jgi:hypothetical protein
VVEIEAIKHPLTPGNYGQLPILRLGSKVGSRLELQDAAGEKRCWEAGEELLDDGTVKGTRTEAHVSRPICRQVGRT